MKDYNTMNKAYYMIWNGLWSLMLAVVLHGSACVWFGSRYLPDRSVLMALALTGAGIGTILTLKRHRNAAGIVINQLLGFSICLAAAAWEYDRIVFAAGVLMAAAVAGGYAALLLVRYRICGSRIVPLAGCIRIFLINGRTLTALVLTLSIAAGLCVRANGTAAEEPRQRSTISSELSTVRKLEDPIWETLDETERLGVLQIIADIEADHLGIERVRVRLRELGDTTLGSYADAIRTITINREWLADMDGFEALEVLCHECFHAYQHRLVDLYTELETDQRQLFAFHRADHYETEFANYIDGDVDYEGYSQQWCEIDSEAYAEEAVWRYLEELEAAGAA